MFRGIMPREGRFFDFFGEISHVLVRAADELVAVVSDLSQVKERSDSISRLEQQGDDITHATIDLLHQTFITPLDRDDIHQLISKLDDVLDFMEAASQRLYLYEVRHLPNEALALAELCLKSVKLIERVIPGLEKLSNPDETKRLCREINQLENDADQVLRAGMAKLFREEADIRQLIKVKEIYELLETVTDRCEDVANIVEGIVLEYS